MFLNRFQVDLQRAAILSETSDQRNETAAIIGENSFVLNIQIEENTLFICLTIVFKEFNHKMGELKGSIKNCFIQLQLLDKDPMQRLGVKGCSSGDISEQAFFRGINFEQLEKKQIIPPFRPQLVSSTSKIVV